jgi:hypothetical protein
MNLSAILLAAVLSMPVYSQGNNGDGTVCRSGLYSEAMCCTTDALGVAALDCELRKSLYDVVSCCRGTIANDAYIASDTPSSRQSFKELCGSRSPKCCVIPQVSFPFL